MVKKLVNDPHNVVPESMEGFALLQPGVSLLEGTTTMIRSDHHASGPEDSLVPVAIITGGGAGHEPADAGYVGAGMLSAAVAGGVFSSPRPDAVYEAIRAVTGAAGALLVVKNYTGDRLNFHLAAELARADGYRVETVLVADDVSLADSDDNAGRRGLAGTVLVCKLAGALAAQGLDLTQIRDRAQTVADSIGTMNLGLTACTVPGLDAPSFTIDEDKVELGLGIHGEPGVRQMRLQPADTMVRSMISRIATERSIRAGAQVVALVGNSGATPPSEIAITARAVAKDLSLRNIELLRLYAGPVMTSLDMAGISITLVRADQDLLQALDAPTTALAWPGHGAHTPQLHTFPVPVRNLAVGDPTAHDETVRSAIDAAARALLDAETELTALDREVGDGDLGTALARAAYGWEEAPAQGDAATQLHLLAGIFRREVGGSSGALYAMGLLKAAGAVGEGWPAALRAGVAGIAELGGAQAGDGTMMDALIPAAEAADRGLEAVVEAARTGAEATADMVARRGRASYLGERAVGHRDPGAVAVVLWLEAVRSAVGGTQ